MGGYHAYDGNGALYPLRSDDVVELVREGKLLPLTPDELSDKSKGDILSKGLAILQTIWFVVQCIVRLIEGLPLTHLEVMTLAYTVMTVAMYITWWDKPLNVNCAIRVPGVPFEGEPKPIPPILIEIFGYLAGDRDAYVEIRKLPRVPTFWAGTPKKETVGYADTVEMLVAIAFGAVHCIAWSYALPSPVKLLLWRVSAIAIIAVPVVALIATPFIWMGDGRGEEISRPLFYLLFPSFWLSCTYIFVGFFIYVGARMILLLLSFSALKSLPYTVFKATQWIEFIPHL